MIVQTSGSEIIITTGTASKRRIVPVFFYSRNARHFISCTSLITPHACTHTHIGSSGGRPFYEETLWKHAPQRPVPSFESIKLSFKMKLGKRKSRRAFSPRTAVMRLSIIQPDWIGRVVQQYIAVHMKGMSLFSLLQLGWMWSSGSENLKILHSTSAFFGSRAVLFNLIQPFWLIECFIVAAWLLLTFSSRVPPEIVA